MLCTRVTDTRVEICCPAVNALKSRVDAKPSCTAAWPCSVPSRRSAHVTHSASAHCNCLHIATATPLLTCCSLLFGCVHFLPQATPDHLVMIKGKGSSRVLYKRAGEVAVGDVMLRMDSADARQLSEAVVVATRTAVNTGLFAPLTTGGTIIVNGVAASVHRCGLLALQCRRGCLSGWIGLESSLIPQESYCWSQQ